MVKLWSAQFWMAIMFSATACVGFLRGDIKPELFIGSLVVPAVVFYFTRERNQIKSKEKQEDKQ